VEEEKRGKDYSHGALKTDELRTGEQMVSPKGSVHGLKVLLGLGETMSGSGKGATGEDRKVRRVLTAGQ